MKKIRPWLGIGFATVLCLAIVLLHSCLTFRMSEKKILTRLSTPLHKAKTGQVGALKYVEVGRQDARMVVFVHGAPGSMADFISIMQDEELRARFRLVSVDRLGYGLSNPGVSEVSVAHQAAALSGVLSLNFSPKPPILVGHSYGATIAARLAMDFPHQIGALVLAAGGFDPRHERKFFINPVLDHWTIKWAVPWAIRVSNDEKLAHPAQLEAMECNWHKVQVPVTLIHGKSDWIVPFENSVFAKQMLVAASQIDTVFLDNLSHLIPWQAPHLIKEAIFKYGNDTK